MAWDDPRAAALRAAMDEEMAVRYAPAPGTTEPAEVVAARQAALRLDPADVVATVLALDDDGTPLGHVAVRMLGDAWEVKRVVVAEHGRRRGVGRALLAAAEDVARRGGGARLVLQTGPRQPDAVGLYEAAGWTRIPVYAPYAGAVGGSVCFERRLDG